MSKQSPAEATLAEMLVEVLNLEDVNPQDIDPNEALFGDGLGLDSIDALEIALAIAQKYGIEMKAEDESTKQAFASLSSLNTFIEANQ